MWTIDVINEKDIKNPLNILYLISGEYKIGRKNASYNFTFDRSVSRFHAIIKVNQLDRNNIEINNEQINNDLSMYQTNELIDQNSRFGTYLNNEKIISNKIYLLKNNDEIKFGALNSIFKLKYKDIIGTISRIPRNKRSYLYDLCSQIGIFISKKPHKNVTHCIVETGPLVATSKILWSLVYKQPLINIIWLETIIHQSAKSNTILTSLPFVEDYLPITEEESKDKNYKNSVENAYLPNNKRDYLFKDHVIIFLNNTKNTSVEMEGIIEAMNGIELKAYEIEQDNIFFDKIEYFLASFKRVIVMDNQPSECQEEYRLNKLLNMGIIKWTLQDLARSIIFMNINIDYDLNSKNNTKMNMMDSLNESKTSETASLVDVDIDKNKNKYIHSSNDNNKIINPPSYSNKENRTTENHSGLKTIQPINKRIMFQELLTKITDDDNEENNDNILDDFTKLIFKKRKDNKNAFETLSDNRDYVLGKRKNTEEYQLSMENEITVLDGNNLKDDQGLHKRMDHLVNTEKLSETYTQTIRSSHSYDPKNVSMIDNNCRILSNIHGRNIFETSTKSCSEILKPKYGNWIDCNVCMFDNKDRYEDLNNEQTTQSNIKYSKLIVKVIYKETSTSEKNIQDKNRFNHVYGTNSRPNYKNFRKGNINLESRFRGIIPCKPVSIDDKVNTDLLKDQEELESYEKKTEKLFDMNNFGMSYLPVNRKSRISRTFD